MHFQKPMPVRTAMQDRLVEARLSLQARIDAALGYPRLKRMFRDRVGYTPDFHKPRTFNEKIQWRKIHDHNPIHVRISDKLGLREYLLETLGPDAQAILPPLRFSTADPDALTLERLSGNVVLKANHASGWNIFIRDGSTIDLSSLRTEARRWLRRSYGKLKHEWAYQPIARKILVEELMLDASGALPRDLKFFMFRDNTAFLQVSQLSEEGHAISFVDENWHRLNFRYAGYDDFDGLPPPPDCYDEMHALARRIGRQFDHIRVDFLHFADRFWLNELTLYRSSGMNAFIPEKWDRYYGDMWTLPDL